MSISSKYKENTSWNPIKGSLLALASLVVSQIIASFILAIFPIVRSWNTNQANNWLYNSIIAQFLFVLIAEIVAVSVVYLYLRRYKGSFKKIGLKKPQWIDPLLGLATFPAYLLIYVIFISSIEKVDRSFNVNQKQQIGFNNVHGPEELILTFISLVLLPPIAEEIIFRGLMFTSIRKVLPFIWSGILTSLLFAAGHLLEGGNSGPLYVAGVDTFILSMFLVTLREKTGRLYPGMMLHAIKNAVAFIALFTPLFSKGIIL